MAFLCSTYNYYCICWLVCFIQDTNQYVSNQMKALEAEQNHIDTRASVVERKLRQLLETGKKHFRNFLQWPSQKLEIQRNCNLKTVLKHHAVTFHDSMLKVMLKYVMLK